MLFKYVISIYGRNVNLHNNRLNTAKGVRIENDIG